MGSLLEAAAFEHIPRLFIDMKYRLTKGRFSYCSQPAISIAARLVRLFLLPPDNRSR